MEEQIHEPKVSVSKRSPVVHFIIQVLLESAKDGRVATYEEMEALCGKDVRRRRTTLYNAIAFVREYSGLVFENVPGKGYQVVQNEDIAENAQELRLKQISKAVCQWKADLRLVDISRLDQKQMTAFSLSALKMSLIDEGIKESQKPQIEEKARTMADSYQDIKDTRAILHLLAC